MRVARIVTAIGVFATLASAGCLALLDQSGLKARVLETFQDSMLLWTNVADQLVAAPVMIGFAIILSMLGAGAVMIWLA